MAIKVVEKAADVRKQIESIARRAKKLDHDIHVAAVSCLHHADRHGDVTLMQSLINALGKSQRRNALIGWAVAHGKFLPDEAGKNVVFDKTKTTRMEDAVGTSPWDFSPERPFTPFDLDAELRKLLKRAETAAKDSRNKVDSAKLAAVLKAVA